MTMIEKMARAMWKRERDSYAHNDPFTLSWYEPAARAALEAMLDATEPMATAGEGSILSGYRADTVFRAMINAALTEEGA